MKTRGLMPKIENLIPNNAQTDKISWSPLINIGMGRDGEEE